MVCSYCGNPLEPGLTFCSKCGRPAPSFGRSTSAPGTMATAARPPKVTLAMTLLIVAFVVGLVTILISWTMVGVTRIFANPTAWLTPIAIILWLILIPTAMQGMNWARIGIAVLILWSIVTLGISTIMLSRYPTVRFTSLAVPWLTCLMRIFAGYLLFTPESNAWFRSRS